MKAVCAWCHHEIGQRESAPGTEETITHGICETCFRHLFSEFGRPLQVYLDGLAIPVLVMDETGTTQAGNRRAGQLLNRAPADLENVPCGLVFACIHARGSEGCGHTGFCSDCAIRNAIVRTHASGTPAYRQPATLQTDENGAGLALLISIEKAGNLVLLRIDKLERTPPIQEP